VQLFLAETLKARAGESARSDPGPFFGQGHTRFHLPRFPRQTERWFFRPKNVIVRCPNMENNEEQKDVRKILLPLKFSQAGSRAFAMALNMAGCCDAWLDIFSVLKPVPGMNLAQKEEFKKEIEAEFDRFKESHAPLFQDFKNYRFAWLMGDPATEILKYAESRSTDLIVLGVHYRNDRPCYNRLGEVAQRVFQLAPCAVMLVPSGVKGEKAVPDDREHLRQRIWEGNAP
jgi:nucleotide-binding universal stress UspA family protein